MFIITRPDSNDWKDEVRIAMFIKIGPEFQCSERYDKVGPEVQRLEG